MHVGTPFTEILIGLLAFGLGSVPFGWLVARIFKGIDLRTVGSGGTGATNCSRLWSGKRSVAVFLLVFALDFSKGLLAALFSARLAGAIGALLGSQTPPLLLQVIGGMGVVLGHVFTPFLGFRGGKGVATTFGVVTALAPLSSLFGLGAWGLLVSLTRYMSLGSMAAVIAIPLSYGLNSGVEVFRSRLFVFLFFLVLAVVVVWRHRANILRLLHGRERRVGVTPSR